MRKQKRAKRTLSLEQKAKWIIDKLNDQVRYYRAIHGHGAISFTMRDIARMSGYAASTKLMNDLYLMCDHGYLILDTHDIKKTGVADTKNVFWLPESFAERPKQKKLFKEIA